MPIGILSCILLLATLLACPSEAGPAVATKHETPNAGFTEILETKCTLCHGKEFWESRNFSKDEWGDVLIRMRNRGAQLTESELLILLQLVGLEDGLLAKRAPHPAVWEAYM